MAERLIIDGFAGMKEVDLDIGQINVLIGPQATGKSLCAKLLFFFRSFLEDLHSTAWNQETKRDLDHRFLERFGQYFPPSTLGNEPFVIRYELADQHIEVKKPAASGTNPTLNYSDYYRRLLVHAKKHAKKLVAEHELSEDDFLPPPERRLRSDLLEMMQRDLGEPVVFSQVFVPAGRSFFAILQRSIFTILSEREELDPFLVEFGSLYERTKNRSYFRGSYLRQSEQRIDVLVSKILLGKHYIRLGRDFLVLEDERRIGLENASSGQQEMLPLAIVLKHMALRSFGEGMTTVYIEEPEAHLFPVAQRHVVELIATVFNTPRRSLQFVITTHSPYILTSFNNLLQAGILEKQMSPPNLKKLHAVVPADQVIAPGSLKAYSLERGGHSKDICDESGLIIAEAIDDVSDELAIQFDKLLELE